MTEPFTNFFLEPDKSMQCGTGTGTPIPSSGGQQLRAGQGPRAAGR